MKLTLKDGRTFEGTLEEYKALNLSSTNTRKNSSNSKSNSVKKYGIREAIDAVKAASNIEEAITAYIGICKQCKTKEKLTVPDENGKVKCSVDAFASKIKEVLIMVLDKEYNNSNPIGTYISKNTIINEIEMLFGSTELPTVEEKLILALRIIDTILNNIQNGDNLLGTALYGELTKVANYNKVVKLASSSIEDKKFMKSKFVPVLDGNEISWDSQEVKEALINASDVVFANKKWLANINN